MPSQNRAILLKDLPENTSKLDIVSFFLDRIGKLGASPLLGIDDVGHIYTPANNTGGNSGRVIVTFASEATADAAVKLNGQSIWPVTGGHSPIKIDANPMELVVLYEPVAGETANLDIVLLHGLTGSAWNTFASNSTNGRIENWIRDDMPRHFKAKGVYPRILTYGYNANIWRDSVVGGIREPADGLFRLLSEERQLCPDRPIMFVAHSLGGLVAKQTILRMKNDSHLSDAASLRPSCVRACMFFGVPHKGSTLPKDFERVVKVLGKVGFRIDKIVDLGAKSKVLVELANEFGQVRHNYNIPILSCWEKKEMGPVGFRKMIVPKESACMEYEGRPEPIGIDQDHSKMIKVKSDLVVGAMLNFAAKAICTESYPTPVPAPTQVNTSGRRSGELISDLPPRQSVLSEPSSQQTSVAPIGLPIRALNSVDVQGAENISALTQPSSAPVQAGSSTASVGTGDQEGNPAVMHNHRYQSHTGPGPGFYGISGGTHHNYFGPVPQTLVEREIGQLDGVVAVTIPTQHYFHYPSYRVLHYITREDPLKAIHQQFQGSRDNKIPTVIILFGMGGCGKSQLALEYCRQGESETWFSAILWLDASSPISIAQSFADIARTFSKPGFDIADDKGNIQFVLDKIEAWQSRWLLIFDNFDDPSSFGNMSIKKYFPRGSYGSILFTSRHAVARNLGYSIEVTTMLKEEALQLLFERSQAKKNDTNLYEGANIVKRLGYHALAIDQAGAYILARELDLGLYIAHYSDRKEKILKEVPQIWDYRRKLKKDSEFETDLTVFTTWELSIQLITGSTEARKDKLHILALAAFLDSKEVSDDLFRWYGSKHIGWLVSCIRNGIWDKYSIQDILVELRNLSLLQTLDIRETETKFSLHPMIQDWVKLRESSENRRKLAYEVILILSTLLKIQNVHNMSFQTKQSLLSHLEIVLYNESEFTILQEDLKKIRLQNAANRFGNFFESQGRYHLAKQMYEKALKGRRKVLGKEHPSTLTSMNNLAGLLESQGKYDEAEPMYRDTLQLREKVLGKEHPDTLTSMNNLAYLLESQGKYDKAEPIYRDTLQLREKVLGKEHPSTLTSMNNLAGLLESQGKYDKAEPMYRDTLQLTEKALGKEHPSTLTSMNNLAGLLESQGKYDEAEPMYRDTLQLREKVLGKEHPDTLTSMNNLAGLLESQGKYDEAEPIYRDTLQLTEKVLGKEHPDTLTSMNNLAVLLKSQGKYDEAEPMYRDTLQLREKVLGKEHPDTLTSMNNLAGLLESQGKYDEAEPMYRDTLQLREKVLGKEHPDTLTSMNNLAYFLKSQGKYDKAEPIYRDTLQLREKVLGKEHPDTLTSMNNLAGLLESQGKYDKAEPMYRDTLQLTEKVLGKEHPSTLTSMNNLAGLLESQGKYDEAEPMYRDTLQLREKVLGKEHPDTLTSMNNLAGLLESQGKYDKAEPMYRDTLQLTEKALGKEHPSTLTSMNNLAGLLESQGKYDEAEPMYRDTLQLTEKVLGKEHPDTLMSMNNLAYFLKSQGKYDEAEPMYRDTLQLREKVLGKEHPDTLMSMNNLAYFLKSQGKYDVAEPI